MSKIRAQFANGATGSAIRTELNGMLPFSATVTLAAASAGTPQHVVPVASVPAGMKVYVTDIQIAVNGATPWADATGVGVNLQDTNGAPVVGAAFAKAGLLANALISKFSASCVLSAAVLLGSGFTTAKGLDLVADKNFTTGSDVVATITGYIA